MVFEETGEGLILRLKVTPKARGDAVGGTVSDASGQESLRIKVRAVPEKGRANTAVIALLAKALGVPKSALTLISGETGRDKRVLVAASSPHPMQNLRAILQDLARPED